MKLGRSEGEHNYLNEWVEGSESECQEDQTDIGHGGRQEFGIVKV